MSRRDFRQIEQTNTRRLMYVRTQRADVTDDYPTGGNVMPCVYITQRFKRPLFDYVTYDSSRTDLVWVPTWVPEGTVLPVLRVNDQLYSWNIESRKFNLLKIHPVTGAIIWRRLINRSPVRPSDSIQRIEALHGTNDVIIKQGDTLHRISEYGDLIWSSGGMFESQTVPGQGRLAPGSGQRLFAVDGGGAIARINAYHNLQRINPEDGTSVWEIDSTAIVPGQTLPLQPTSVVSQMGGGFVVSIGFNGSLSGTIYSVNKYATDGSVIWSNYFYFGVYSYSETIVACDPVTDFPLTTVNQSGVPNDTWGRTLGFGNRQADGTLISQSYNWNMPGNDNWITLARGTPSGFLATTYNPAVHRPGFVDYAASLLLIRLSGYSYTLPWSSSISTLSGVNPQPGLRSIAGAPLMVGSAVDVYAGASPVMDMCGEIIEGAEWYFGVGRALHQTGGGWFNMYALNASGAAVWTLPWGASDQGQSAYGCAIADDGYLYVGGDVTE